MRKVALRPIITRLAVSFAVLGFLLVLLPMTVFGMESPKPKKKPLSAPQKEVLAVAGRLLDEAQVSYVYGGYQLGDAEACKTCNTCLEAAKPKPKERLVKCPVCKQCSLDCSHFTELVYREAGFPYPYIETASMLRASAETLRRNYHLVDLGLAVDRMQPGDLLVYDGHVVMLEKRHAPVAGSAAWRGDIVHATGGKDIRAPGEGIQRERFVDVTTFRGPLRRILRHAALTEENP